LAILTSVVFAVIGIWMILEVPWFGWFELGLWSPGLVVLIVMNLHGRHWLRLEPSCFRRFPGFGHPRLAWSEVKRFFLTADDQTVVYELVPNPGETSEYPDEYFAHSPSTYGLTAPELLELLNHYKQFAGQLHPWLISGVMILSHEHSSSLVSPVADRLTTRTRSVRPSKFCA
jgi:hypothetical protein